MCLRDARFKKFFDSILGMITASLYDDPIYDMDGGSKPFSLIYCIYYKFLGTQLNLHARVKDLDGKTILI